MMNETQNNATENNTKDKKKLLKIIIIIVSLISIHNGFTITNKKMIVFNGIPWSGECEMQGRKESREECLERKEKNLAEAKEFLIQNEQKMKLIQLICIVTIIVLALIIKEAGYTIISIILTPISLIALLL